MCQAAIGLRASDGVDLVDAGHAAAARVTGATPPVAASGGTQTTTRSTPATRAGTAVISSVDG